MGRRIWAVAMVVALGVSLAHGARGDEVEDERAAYAKLYAGTVDLYLSIAEVQNHKPSVANVQFKDVVRVGSTRFIQFADSTGVWLIEPKMIYAAKIQNAK